jgi:DNA-nicking Smr family endonuclease
MKKRGKALSEEDRILWHSVAVTATPLKGKAAPLISAPQVEVKPVAPDSLGVALPAAGSHEAKRPAPKTIAPPQQRIDKPTHTKIAKGRIVIEGKVDLHGLTQSEAHSMLLGFLHQAFARGRRHVLVVTGKGASFGSDGVLKRAVPAWFATPPFRALVGGYHEAARQHGGAGALYVKLRRRPE